MDTKSYFISAESRTANTTSFHTTSVPNISESTANGIITEVTRDMITPIVEKYGNIMDWSVLHETDHMRISKFVWRKNNKVVAELILNIVRK